MSPTQSAGAAVDSRTSVTEGAAAVLLLGTGSRLVSACSGLSAQTVFEIARLRSLVNLKWSMAAARRRNSGSVACAAQVG